MPDALRQTSFDRGVARELVLVLTASDNMAAYRCDAKNEAKRIISAQTKLRVHCESDLRRRAQLWPNIRFCPELMFAFCSVWFPSYRAKSQDHNQTRGAASGPGGNTGVPVGKQ